MVVPEQTKKENISNQNPNVHQPKYVWSLGIGATRLSAATKTEKPADTSSASGGGQLFVFILGTKFGVTSRHIHTPVGGKEKYK